MSNLSAFAYIPERAPAVPALWNDIFSVLSANIASVDSTVGLGHFQQLSIGSTPPSYLTTAAVTIEVSSAYSDYLYLVDSSAQKSSYIIGSRAGNLADGLNIWDVSGATMIASFSKNSIRFFQNVVGPVFDTGGALADTYNAATFIGSGSTLSGIQAAINQASIDGISRVYLPSSMYPYSASSISFINTVQMVREGGASDVYDWQAYGADPLGVVSIVSAVNASINGAETVGGTSYGPPGNYSQGPSNGAAPPVAGDYSIKVGSGVQLLMAPSCIVNRRYAGGGVVNAGIRNKTITSSGNTDIAVIGGILKSTNVLNTGKHIGLTRVARLALWDTHFAGVQGDWNTSINATYATIRGLVMESGTGVTNDGIHIVGGQFITVEGCVVDCGDDCISIYPDQDGNENNISDVVVRGIVARTAASNVIRVGTPSACTETIQRISISDVVGIAGTSGGNGIAIKDTAANRQVTDISLANITLDCSANGGSGMTITDINRLVCQNVKLIAPSSRIEIDGGADITLDNCSVVSLRGAGVQALLVANTSTVSRLKILGGSYESATEHGIILGSTGTVADFEVIGVTIRNCTNDGLRLLKANGGRVIGNRATGNGANGIDEIAPSSNNVIIGNDTRGNTGGATILAGAATEAFLNLGAAGSMKGRYYGGSIALTDAANVITSAVSANFFQLTLAGNRTINAPLNPTAGQRIHYVVIQDSTGSRTLTWNSAFRTFWSDAYATPNQRSSVAFIYNGTDWTQEGAQSGAAVLYNGGPQAPIVSFLSETSLGFYRSSASVLALSYGMLAHPDGSNTTPSIGFSSNTSLGLYSSGAQTIAQSLGTLNLATNAVRFSMRTLAASSVTASAAKTNVATNEVVFTIGGASGASLIISSGGTAYIFNSASSAILA